MEKLRVDVNGSFDNFIAEQRNVEGECRATLVEFNQRPNKKYTALALAEVPHMNLLPRGMTALYDAIGATLEHEGKRISEEKWADLVIVVIITDGAENSSHDYSQARVKEMVSHAEANGWQFVFLAANQDAWSAAAAIGTQSRNVSAFAATGQGVQQSYKYAGDQTRSLRMGKPT
jgi:hypothetical protein